MSTHPNAILMAVLTPDDLSRKTYRAIVEAAGGELYDEGGGRVKIAGRDYTIDVMEDSYDDSNQISAPEGSIVARVFLTYGYGEVIAWEEVAKMQRELDEWSADMCKRFSCTHAIQITANYW